MNERDVELIDKALRGELTSLQEDEFRKRLTTDPEFRALHDDMGLMIRAVRSVAAEKMIRKAGQQHQPEARSVSWVSSRSLALAAVIMLLLMAGLWLYTRQSQDLVSQYYTAYSDMELAQPRGGSDVYDIKFRGLEAYKLHELTKALQILDSALALSSDDPETLTLTGLCHLEQSSYRKAIDAFNRIEDVQGESPALLWYKALAYLGLKEYRKTRELLDQVEQKAPNPYAAKAAALKAKLPAD